jgi:putative Holliday junction resolvase
MTGPGRVLGLDLGDARIGVALSDDDRRVAVPIGTVHVGQPPGELVAIADLAREHDANLLVLGLPLSMDGTRGSQAAHVEAFADALSAVVHVPIAFQDERLSTVEADRKLGQAGVPARERRRIVDATAAQVLLQAWLDAQGRDAHRSVED